MDRLHVALVVIAIVLAGALAYTYTAANALRAENEALKAKLREAENRAAELNKKVAELGKRVEELEGERENLRSRVSALEANVSRLTALLQGKSKLADLLLAPTVVVVNNASTISARVEARPGYLKVAGVVYVIDVSGIDELPSGSEVVVVVRQANPLLGGLLVFTLNSGGGKLIIDNLYPRKAVWKVEKIGDKVRINVTIPYDDLTLSQMYIYMGVASVVGGEAHILLPDSARLVEAKTYTGPDGCTHLKGVLVYEGPTKHLMELVVEKGSSYTAPLDVKPGDRLSIDVKLGCRGGHVYLWALLPWPA